jgi:hypothetical protein
MNTILLTPTVCNGAGRDKSVYSTVLMDACCAIKRNSKPYSAEGTGKQAGGGLQGYCGVFVSFLYDETKVGSVMGCGGWGEGGKAGSNSYRLYFELARGGHTTRYIDFRSYSIQIRFSIHALVILPRAAFPFFPCSSFNDTARN